MKLENAVDLIKSCIEQEHFILKVSTQRNDNTQLYFDPDTEILFYMGTKTPYKASDIVWISTNLEDDFNDSINIAFFSGDKLKINKFAEDEATVSEKKYYGNDIITAYKSLESKNTIYYLRTLFEDGITCAFDKRTLASSCFYYCCGKDPTPIIALNSICSLFIYADIIDYGNGDFSSETLMLYNRLKAQKHQLVDLIPVVSQTKTDIKNAEISKWISNHGDEYYVAYFQGDACKVFKKIYSEKDNYIQPKYICNHRTEFLKDEHFFDAIEKRIEYILGDCFNDKYERIDNYRYYGDYISDDNIFVPLYKRMYWYVY